MGSHSFLAESSQLITSDTSGSWGCGAYWPDDANCVHWIQSPHWQEKNIASNELLPVVVSAAIWGPVGEGTAFRKLCLLLTHTPSVYPTYFFASFFVEAKCDLEREAVYLPGSMNAAANAISRNNASTFLSLFLQADKAPTHLPPTLVELLTDQSIMSTLEGLVQSFKAWPLERDLPMHPHKEGMLCSISQGSSNASH
jgi:hypothetical protein